jgi:hypothetical protein
MSTRSMFVVALHPRVELCHAMGPKPRPKPRPSSPTRPLPPILAGSPKDTRL